MGSMGKRPTRSKNINPSQYEEPALFKDVATITEYAKSHGMYDGDIINLDRAISMFSDIKVDYCPMSKA